MPKWLDKVLGRDTLPVDSLFREACRVAHGKPAPPAEWWCLRDGLRMRFAIVEFGGGLGLQVTVNWEGTDWSVYARADARALMYKHLHRYAFNGMGPVSVYQRGGISGAPIGLSASGPLRSRWCRVAREVGT